MNTRTKLKLARGHALWAIQNRVKRLGIITRAWNINRHLEDNCVSVVAPIAEIRSLLKALKSRQKPNTYFTSGLPRELWGQIILKGTK